MRRLLPPGTAATAAPGHVDWTVTVTEALPHCPSAMAAWERIATQTAWTQWRSPSPMRGDGVRVTVVPPATEPLRAGDEYVVRVGRLMTVRCRVLESSSAPATAHGNGPLVFDAAGVALGGLVRARFRFTVFTTPEGVVMARAQEKILSLPVLAPSEEALANEHRHTFSELDRSFRSPTPSPPKDDLTE